MEVRAIQSIERMVLAGVGVGFVSRMALADTGGLPSGLPCLDGPLTRELAIVRRRDRTPSPASAAFERAFVAASERSPGT